MYHPGHTDAASAWKSSPEAAHSHLHNFPARDSADPEDLSQDGDKSDDSRAEWSSTHVQLNLFSRDALPGTAAAEQHAWNDLQGIYSWPPKFPMFPSSY
jgi:hypothetical protein